MKSKPSLLSRYLLQYSSIGDGFKNWKNKERWFSSGEKHSSGGEMQVIASVELWLWRYRRSQSINIRKQFRHEGTYTPGVVLRW